MGDSKTSNKDIAELIAKGNADLLNAVNGLTTALTAEAVAAAPIAANDDEATESSDIEVDAAYLGHMNLKAAEHATAKGSEVVLYTRRNKAGQTKLAYALRARFDTEITKQPSCIGPVGSFQP